MNPGKPHNAVWSIVWIALVYFVAARLALLMAIPPGYAAAIWPASGIALGAVLTRGRLALVGVALGSAVANSTVAWSNGGQGGASSPTLASLVVVPLLLGLGAALQAGLSARWVRRPEQRRDGTVPALLDEREIARFFLLGGPVGCVVAASLGVAVLHLAGALPRDAVLVTWGTWWTGDTLGVLLFAPLTLSFIGAPGGPWRRRRASLAVPLMLGALAVTALFFRVSSWEGARIQDRLAARAQELSQQLHTRLGDYVDEVAAIAALHRVQPSVTPEQFEDFVGRMLRRHPGLQALEWAPRVSAAERPRFERETRAPAGGLGLPIVSRGADGKLGPAPDAPFHFPLRHVAPVSGNEPAMGLDLASIPNRLATVRRALTADGPQATAPILLVQRPWGGPSILVLVPVMVGPPAPGLAHVRGLAVGVFSVAQVVDATLDSGHRDGLELRIEDITDPESPQLLYASDGARASSGSCEGCWTDRFELAGRTWALSFAPTRVYLTGAQSWEPWLVAVGGLLLVGLLSAGVLLVSSRTYALEREIAERTEHLRENEAQLQAIMESVPDALVSVDEGGRLIYANPAAEVLFGRSEDELLGRPATELLSPPYREGERAGRLQDLPRALEAAGTLRSVEAAVLGPSGREIPVEVDVASWRRGGALFYTAALRDVSERQAAEALRAQLAAIVESTDDAILAISPHGIVTAMNPAATRLYGYPEADLVGHPVDVLSPAHLVDESHEKLERVLAGGSFALETVRIRADGEPLEVWLTASPIRGADGRIVGVSSIARDVGEAKRQGRVLRESLREKEVLLQEVHHRVKNNLQVISSLLKLQRRNFSDPAARAAIDDSYTRVRSIALVHEQLYQSSDLAMIDFERYARALVQHILGSLTTGGSAVATFDIQSVTLGIDRAIPCGLIVSELVTNALKHAFPDGRRGRLHVALRKKAGDVVELVVGDDGVGIPEDALAAERNSLGLVLVRTLAEQIVAKLAVDSSSEGTTFRLEFTLQEQPKPC